MTENQKPASVPKFVGRQMTYDSAEHLLAAFPVLLVMTRWTGKIGMAYIQKFVLSGKIKEARRNAAIIATGIVAIFGAIMGCVIWLASL